MATVKSVMRTYLAVVGLFNLSASLIWGVNTLFLLDAGLSLTQTFTANAFYTLGMVIFEIPTGVVADTLGRRTSFLASLIILFFGTLAYVFLAGQPVNMVYWAAASIFLGLGFTFYSGAVEAWVVDALDAVDAKGPKDVVFARGGQIAGAAMLVGTLSGGVLGQFNLAWPYLVRAGLLAACFFVAFMAMRDLGFERRTFKVRAIPQEMNTVLKHSLRDGWRKPPVRLLLLISMIHWGFLIWGWYAWQPHFVALGGGQIWLAGAIAAAVSVTMIVGNGLGPKLAVWMGDRSWLLALSQTVFIVGLAGVALADSFWPAVLAFLLAMTAFGIHEPVRMAMLHALIPSRTRATVISFGGLMASAAGVVTQIALADYAEAHDIPAGYAIGAMVMILAVPLAIMGGRIAGPEACAPEPTDSVA